MADTTLPVREAVTEKITFLVTPSMKRALTEAAIAQGFRSAAGLTKAWAVGVVRARERAKP